MHGPYHALVTIGGETITLTADDAQEGSRTADRFYASGGGTGLLSGFTRAAVFTTAELLEPGQRATVEIIGRDGPEGSSKPCGASAKDGDHRGCWMCDGSGRRTARDTRARTESARRDEHGRFLSSLGSRFGERVFSSV